MGHPRLVTPTPFFREQESDEAKALHGMAMGTLPASRGGWVWRDRPGVLGRAPAVWGGSRCAIPKELWGVLRFGF